MDAGEADALSDKLMELGVLSVTTEDAAAGTPEEKPVFDEEAQTAKQLARDTELQQLVDSKQYFLPINAVEKRKTKRYIQEAATYVVNQSKWKAATEFCKDHGWEFQVITEKHLGI